jgi:hypothetical protein
MTTMLFVHGTGVREAGYDKNYKLIAPRIRDLGCEPARCLWGDQCGSKFDGAALPGYESEVDRQDLALWRMLLQDPFAELALLETAATDAGVSNHGDIVWERLIQKVPSEGTKAELQRLMFDGLWQNAFDALTREPDGRWERLVKDTAGNDGVFETALTRCLVALLCISAQEEGQPSLDRQAREGLVRLLVTDFGGSARGIGGAVAKFAVGLFAPLATPILKWTRDSWSNGASPGAGDVLMYQARGAKIREFIRDQVNAQNGPVIILAHSLGGIASVDLLLLTHLPQVRALVTVGSQAPYLYEINALNGLEKGAPWPETFPSKWLNFYDPNDFLSYPGEGLLPGRVRDFRIRSHQPFPESHSAYWRAPALWTELKRFLAEVRA